MNCDYAKFNRYDPFRCSVTVKNTNKTFLPVTNGLHFRSSWFGNRLACNLKF